MRYCARHQITLVALGIIWILLFRIFLWTSLCTFSNVSMHSLHSLEWRHNGWHGVSNHQPHDCLLNRWFRRRSKKALKLRFTGLCAGNSPVTGEFPAQRATNAENVSIWWRHHVYIFAFLCRAIAYWLKFSILHVRLWTKFVVCKGYQKIKQRKKTTQKLKQILLIFMLFIHR